MNDAAQETDVAKQRALYSQMNDLLLDESFVAFVAPTTGSSYIARREGQKHRLHGPRVAVAHPDLVGVGCRALTEIREWTGLIE